MKLNIFLQSLQCVVFRRLRISECPRNICKMLMRSSLNFELYSDHELKKKTQTTKMVPLLYFVFSGFRQSGTYRLNIPLPWALGVRGWGVGNRTDCLGIGDSSQGGGRERKQHLLPSSNTDPPTFNIFKCTFYKPQAGKCCALSKRLALMADEEQFPRNQNWCEQ